ncbi:MAG: T9SS type A sorting domain-containing protein [Bacteroidetes bacterium]|nr:T9SS type A sorting domain-containing protein [Bacteroidota bacterium]
MRKITMFLVIIAFVVMNMSSYRCSGQWVQSNGIDGGDYRCLAKFGTEIYAGSQYGGVYRSTNNGDSWIPKFNGLPGGASVTQMLVNGSSIFAGTSYWSKLGQGVFRSDDHGDTWVAKNTGIEVSANGYFTDLYITGLARTSTYLFASTYQNGIFRSSNNGDSWVKVFDAYGPPDSTGIGIDSTVFRMVYAMCAVGDVIFAGGSSGTVSQQGIYRSFDQGLTWDVVSTGFPSGNNIYQLVSSGSDFYAKTSFGFFWSPSNGDYFIGINNGISKPEGAANGTICAEGPVIYAATNDGNEGPKTYKSVNHGSTWTSIPALSAYMVEALLSNGDNVFAGNLGNFGMTAHGGGVVRSLDGGATWAESSTGLSGVNCDAFTANGTDIFAGTYFYSGIYKSTNAGANWNKTLLPGTTTNSQVFTMATSGTTVYAGVNNTLGVFKSDDNGATWTQTTSIGKVVRALGSNATYVFAGTNNDGMRRTSNGGTTWTTINSGLPTIGEKSIRAITFYGTNIWIGNARGVFVSSNDGTTWTAANGGVGSPGYGLVKSVAVKGDTVFGTATGGIIRSTDKGLSWTLLPATIGISNVLLFDGPTLYAGGTGGVYLSNDMGNTWTSMNTAFPSIPEVLGLYAANGMLYAGTYGQSVWKYSFSLPPVAFSVTGGGTYCQGGTGLPVGLSNSTTGVTYILYKNSVAQVPTVAGTGAAISFGDQVAGDYTIAGTNGAGTTQMTGSAVITETSAAVVSVTIGAEINPVVAGTAVTFTAIPVNGGAAPSYQWKVNGVNSGTDNALFTYIPINADKVICKLTSSETCTTGNPATSNQIAMTVIPENTNLQNIIVVNGEINCYDAILTIYVAGSGTTFTVQDGGSATMIAGQNIIYLPGTSIDSGAYMHGYITLTGDFCISPMNPVVNTPVPHGNIQASGPAIMMNENVRIYPNPAGGSFTIQLTGTAEPTMSNVEIYSMNGVKVLSADIPGELKHTFGVENMRPGLYFIQVTTGTSIKTMKLIKL